MFDSKSAWVKIGGYLLIGFFAAIIIISFGMPDFISKMDMDDNIIAIINGEKHSRLDYHRFREGRFRDMNTEKMDAMLFNYYVSEVLMLQQARKEGFNPSDERIVEVIHSIEGLKNPETGKYDPERLKLLLQSRNMTITELHKLVKNDIVRNDYWQYIRMGIAIPSDEAAQEFNISNSKLQIQYANLSNADLKKILGDKITVSDKEINTEMQQNKSEVKDPKTDRERIKRKLEEQKINTAKAELVKKIDELAVNGGSFAEAANILGGTRGTSSPFKIGENPVEASPNGKPLSDIASSRYFREELLTMKEKTSSRVVNSAGGLYIFSLIKNDYKGDKPADNELTAAAERIENEILRLAHENIMQKIQEKSKIIKNLKTN
jgi:hypothetical protein